MDHNKAIDYILRRMQEELPNNLRYHSLEHTLGVLHSCDYLAKKQGIRGDDLKILRTAAAFHDSGFVLSYQNHEELSSNIAAEHLPEFGYSEEQIKTIQSMIRATKLPQSPATLLEKTLCDADLDYLGGDNYGEISESLYDELGMNGIEMSEEKWLDVQIKFLENHHYWTDFATTVLSPRKEMVLQRLRALKNN